MAKSVKALINPSMLAWAREQAGFSPDEAARRLHIEEERLAALEKGDETPTFAKLLDIADLYKRPVSLSRPRPRAGSRSRISGACPASTKGFPRS